MVTSATSRVRGTCQCFHVTRFASAYHLGVEPLLTASSLRVDISGTPAVEGLSLTSTGDRVLVLGAARALFEAAAGLRPVTRGELLVAGQAPVAALEAGTVAGAALDPPLPSTWTVRHYVTWSARLAGHPSGTARALAGEAIERMKLGELATQKLAGVPAAGRRGTVIAAAIATGAPVVLVEDPVGGLPDEAGRSFARVIVRALADRRSLFFAARLPLDSPIALAADEAIVIDGPRVGGQGDPAEIAAKDSAFVLRVSGDARAFVDAVEAQGGRLLGSPGDPALARLTIDLGALRTRDLLRIAADSNAVVLELRPLGRAFA
jgi:ABC-type multidrug transport system ATPase subunit